MKNTDALLVFFSVFASCSPAQQPADPAEIHKMFQIASGVKEIQTVIISVTTLGERSFTSKTTFEESGEPIETTTYNKDGKIEKKEPWVRAKEDDFEGSKVRQEFDKNKRPVKSSTYTNGVITHQIQYKYDASGNKIESLEKNRKIEYKYLNNLLSEEITYNKAEDNQFYWYVKKKFKYDEKSDLTEMLVYYYPDKETISGKYLYKYDSKGSLIQAIGYAGNEIIETTNRKIVYY